MACDHYLVLINRELDGTIAPADQAALDSHLKTCAGCSRERADQRAIHGAFQDLRPVVVPDGLSQRIAEAAVAPRAPAPLFALPRLHRAASVAAVVALCLTSGFVGARAARVDPVTAAPNVEARETTQFKRFLEEKLQLPAAKVADIIAVKQETDSQLHSLARDFGERKDKLLQQELRQIWEKLSPQERERYSTFDASFPLANPK